MNFLRFSRDDAINWYQWNKIIIYRKIAAFLISDAKASDEPKAIRKMRTMYKACKDMDNVSTILKSPNIAAYLKKLDFPYCPDGILIANYDKVPSMIESEWIESVAKIKNVTGLDSIIGFAIIPDPKNQSRNVIHLGVPRKGSLL